MTEGAARDVTLDDVRVAEMDDDALARLVTTLGRRGESETEAWRAVQAELSRRRLQNSAPPAPTAPSLRSQVLDLLVRAPGSTPSQLAQKLERSTTVVSRVLAAVMSSGEVLYDTDTDDGRLRHYRLATPVEASEGGSTAVPRSAGDDVRQYLVLAITGAVRARRQSNDLPYAIDRLSRALSRALEVGADEWALVARRELMTSLRQAGRTSELEPHFTALYDIERGVSSVGQHLVLPATGCLAYELGRQTSVAPRERLECLTAAATAFRLCASLPEAEEWSPREGWALLSAADLWREATEFGVALSLAQRAADIFRRYDDTYGAAESMQLLGSCYLLRGDFTSAIASLNEAFDLAKGGGTDRCTADVLIQLGDAHRCAGLLDLATEHLTEGAAIAERLERRASLGFSLSALAAVAFARRDYQCAWHHASKAAGHLESSPHGNALNHRRQAVIARELVSHGDESLLGDCSRLFHASLQEYRDLASPAGIAACCIGLGRLLTDASDPASSRVIRDLVAVAKTRLGKLLLPLDPWIPALLRRWALETDAAEVHLVADWITSSDVEYSSVDEMAGEPRVESSLLAA